MKYHYRVLKHAYIVIFRIYDYFSMEYKYTIEGETPGKKNNIKFSKYGTYKTKRFKDWHQKALAELQMQKIPSEPLDCFLNIRLDFIHGDLVRRDSDNGCSSIMDLLQDAKIIKDDMWQIVRHISIYNSYSPKNARCEITITCAEE